MPLNLLYAEDDDEDFQLFSDSVALIKGDDIRLTRAVDMQDAEKIIDQEDFDLLLFDFQLSQTNPAQDTGLDLIKSVRGRGQKTPIVLITGKSEVLAHGLDIAQMEKDDVVFLSKRDFSSENVRQILRAALAKEI